VNLRVRKSNYFWADLAKRVDAAQCSYRDFASQFAFVMQRLQPSLPIASWLKSVYALDMILEKFPEVRRLTASEKLIFVSELWNDLEAHPSEVPVSREILAELDRRMEHFRQHPEEFTTWEAVKERILSSR
jgi:putative addiction module component (TIGR02574 family)